MRLLIFLLFASFVVKSPLARAEEPFFKPNDVVALVGGEDMVVASELGYLETLIQRALPGHKLKFRSLAWEGDTVFQQARDLNYPTLEAQLDKIGATVVICQFGQSESLAGKEKLADFTTAYERTITQLVGGRKRRVVVLTPSCIVLKQSTPSGEESLFEPFFEYLQAEHQVAAKFNLPIVECSNIPVIPHGGPWTRDPLHLNEAGHKLLTLQVAMALASYEPPAGPTVTGERYRQSSDKLRQFVAAKNKLWFNYYRPQNWAFLAGDRTNQPSSRDHKDPSKRWFPEELEKFIPLIEAKEQEIWALVEKLAKEGGAK
jgi:hypothetical protein